MGMADTLSHDGCERAHALSSASLPALLEWPRAPLTGDQVELENERSISCGAPVDTGR